jgi:hypothetical protein
MTIRAQQDALINFLLNTYPTSRIAFMLNSHPSYFLSAT